MMCAVVGRGELHQAHVFVLGRHSTNTDQQHTRPHGTRSCSAHARFKLIKVEINSLIKHRVYDIPITFPKILHSRSDHCIKVPTAFDISDFNSHL